MKKVILFLAITLIIVIIGISSYANISVGNTKHYDNGTIAFDYPGNLSIQTGQNEINIEDSSYNGCSILFTEYPSESTLNNGTSDKQMNFEAYMNNFIFEDADIIEKNKITISGRSAYNVSERIPEGIVQYATYIDFELGVFAITHNVDVSIQDQRTTPDYKAYETVVNSFQIK